MKFRYLSGILVIGICGCDVGLDHATVSPASSRQTISVPATPPRRRVEKLLPPDELRVPLLVLPGDAIVEVDDQVVERRNGAIDLVGKMGESHRIRISKTGHISKERIVTIERLGASPSIVDLNELMGMGKQ